MSDSRIRETYQLSSCAVVKYILFCIYYIFEQLYGSHNSQAYWIFFIALHFIKMDKIDIKTKLFHPSPQCLGIVSEQSVQSWWRTRRWQYLLDTTGKLYIWTQINLPARTRTLQVLVRQNSHLELGDAGTKISFLVLPGSYWEKRQLPIKVIGCPYSSGCPHKLRIFWQ